MKIKSQSTLLSLIFFSGYSIADEADFEHLFSLDLAQLMSTKVSGVGALTETSRLKTPAAVTHISNDNIQLSGARSLHELLDIYVPGVQWVRHHWEFSHIGARGIISDRENKLLIRVNGRVMNEHTHNGAVSERNFPMLSDIQHINVIRGAGSALYGLGAVSMVIDIQTFNASTHSENKVTLKTAINNQFHSIEGSLSKTFDNDISAYLYAAIAMVDGANDSDAPLVLGTDATSLTTNAAVKRGQPFPVGVNDGAQYDDEAPIKFHLELTKGNSDFWLRYTSAGEVEPTDVFFVAAPPVGVGEQARMQIDNGYQQLTATAKHQYDYQDEIALTFQLSYDTFDYVQLSPFSAKKSENFSFREDEWLIKIGSQWDNIADNSFFIGAEISYERFGLNSLRSGRGKATSDRLGEMTPWSTTTSSLLTEWQWRASPALTTFIGGRLDKNTYTNNLFSPRASLVWSNDDINTYKLMLTRSQRMNFAEDNRASALISSDKQKPEVLDSIEARYEHVESSIQYSLSLFYLQLDALSWDNTLRQSIVTGEQEQWGFEFQFDKVINSHQFSLSHSYTKLIDFELATPDSNTLITAKPYGFGNDLSAWSNHTSKLRYNYVWSDKLNLNASLRAYWGFPGVRDYWDKYNNDGLTLMDADWEKGTEKQLFLNMGAHYILNDNLQLSLNLYNVLGLVDKDYNKRLYYNTYGDYRSEAVSAALSLTAIF
ncbi:TonB-dependent siderophore receptor [Psychrobium sp. 1_MG-2023]|uniref:TonB-dependent receptor plug domain-containing protein n=1 Tax=Psychrobium sp. 1_MG-2023 TaxID=3062624 RepID=UPI000C33E581|nr:TonB-dependent receptor [Psychrobium sp. 1_MG-2023]MDP2561386.1 TonB-dependent receptor [Psychrobium sp. 1_MG-2023]PKF54867.1 hypothetical protein CW748_15070 [Alteromonadales bacterium alter-6D02]